jgi:signal peptidase II
MSLYRLKKDDAEQEVRQSGPILTKGRMAVLVVFAVLLIDEAIKIWVKTSMTLHESIHVTDWFYITFIENNGMAFGMQLGSKIILSLFRVIAISALGYYIWLEVKRQAKTGYIVCLSFILAGAAGNLIDCMFYGLVFNASSPYYLSYFVPFGTGYAPFLMGKVVDMFYFPLIETEWPLWMPFVGGEHFVFFSPVFNFADSCISVSVVWLLLFYREAISKMSLGKSVVQQEDQSDQEK